MKMLNQWTGLFLLVVLLAGRAVEAQNVEGSGQPRDITAQVGEGVELSGVVAVIDEKESEEKPVAASLLRGEWQLVRIGDKPIGEGLETPVMKVTDEGSVSGSTGVNRFFGGLADKGDTLFGPLGSTRRAGPPAAMKLEASFLAALGKATDFCRGTDKLRLLDAEDKVLLLFQAKPAAESE